ncbi:MAG: chemotaxis protein CheW [Oscillospiraceae bacterium]|jgi:purine-binding chemotaxis protein CheW|nr:chemotaxis protein CheW [Oscillospiraceae bacterium]
MDELFDIELSEEDAMRDKYLTFRVNTQAYAIPIRYVTEIIGAQTPTPVPRTPEFITGLINLRGAVVPVIDLNLRFGRRETAPTEKSCVIILLFDTMHIGAAVDEVLDVMTIEDAELRAASGAHEGADGGFVTAIGVRETTALQIIDVTRVFDLD